MGSYQCTGHPSVVKIRSPPASPVQEKQISITIFNMAKTFNAINAFRGGNVGFVTRKGMDSRILNTDGNDNRSRLNGRERIAKKNSDPKKIVRVPRKG